MTRPYRWTDCALSCCVLLPIMAAILLGRAIGLTVLAAWELATTDRLRRD